MFYKIIQIEAMLLDKYTTITKKTINYKEKKNNEKE